MTSNAPFHCLGAGALLLSCSSLSVAQMPVRPARPSLPVEAGKGCPSLAPIEAWGRRNVENYSYNDVFCGDFNGDGRADALAFVNFEMGNTMGHDVVLFRNVGGALRFWRRVPDLYGQPKSAAFSRDKVILNMIMMRPGDPRCCPSGNTRVVVNAATGTHNQSR